MQAKYMLSQQQFVLHPDTFAELSLPQVASIVLDALLGLMGCILALHGLRIQLSLFLLFTGQAGILLRAGC